MAVCQTAGRGALPLMTAIFNIYRNIYIYDKIEEHRRRNRRPGNF